MLICKHIFISLFMHIHLNIYKKKIHMHIKEQKKKSQIKIKR